MEANTNPNNNDDAIPCQPAQNQEQSIDSDQSGAQAKKLKNKKKIRKWKLRHRS